MKYITSEPFIWWIVEQAALTGERVAYILLHLPLRAPSIM